MRMIYSKGGYNIYRSRYKKCGYIIHNSRKEFKNGHTHIESFRVAKEIVDSVIEEKIPNHFSIYFLISLIRISDDEEYIERINKRIKSKRKKQNYINVNKGCVKNAKPRKR